MIKTLCLYAACYDFRVFPPTMHLVPPSPSPSPCAAVAVAPRDSAFFFKLFDTCYQYLDAARYAQGVLVLPRFANGDLLLVRLKRQDGMGFSVEFPKGSPQTTNCPQANALNFTTQSEEFDWSLRSVLRLGVVDSPKAKSPLDVFLLAVPSGALPPTTDLEGVNRPLRIPEQEFRKMIDRAEVSDSDTLAAYALFLTRQSLQTSGTVIPLLDRRKPLRRFALVTPEHSQGPRGS
jgi:hypothetical protein